MDDRQPQCHHVKTDNELIREHFDKRLDEVIVLIKSGFPNGDPVEHCKAHEARIKNAAERAELYKSIRDKSITGVFLSLASFVLLALWEYFKSEVRK